MIQRFHLLFIIVLIATLSITPVLSQEDPSVVVIVPGEPIHIGVSLGTRAGSAGSALGIDAWRGITLAQEDAPDIQFGEQSFPLIFDQQDSGCSAAGAAANAKYFTADPRFVAILGPHCSDACMAAAPIYDAAGYSLVSAGCTSAAIPRAEFTSFNHTLPGNAGQAIVAADYFYETLGIRRVSVIYEGGFYGGGLADTMVERFEELGGEILSARTIALGDTDFSELLAEIAAEAPEGLYFAGHTGEAYHLVDQLGDSDLSEVPLFGVSGWMSSLLLDIVGDGPAEPLYLAAHLPVTGDEEQAARLAEFLTRYEEAFGEAPISHVHDNAYDSYMMLRAAIEQVGSLAEDGNLRIDRAELAAALRAYGPVQGLSGTIECVGNGDCLFAPISIYQVQNSEFVIIEEREDPATARE